jgi:uncharacterized protein (TIGR03067 family)
MRVATLALALLIAIAARGDEKESKALQGTWVPETAEFAGKMFPKNFKLVLKGDTYTVQNDKGTVKLSATAKPKEMDITGTDGPNKGRTFLAIYELDGDTLKICYDLAGKVRPTEFKTTVGTQLFLVTYKREKP